MEDVFKSIKAFLYDRTVSPLFGAYVMSTFVWNYRVVVVLFDGHATLTEKLTFLDYYFGIVNYSFFGYSFQILGQFVHGFFGPTLLTLLYLFIYPRLAKPVYEHSLTKQKELKDIKQRIEDFRLLTVEESRKLMKEIEQIRFKADEEAQQYRARIASLTETINALETKQKSEQSNATESIKKIARKPKSDLKALENEAIKQIETLPNGEYQLSELIGSERWNNLNEIDKHDLTVNFKRLVERGDIVEVDLADNKINNKIIFRKRGANLSPNILSFVNSLEYIFPKEKFDSEAQRLDLLSKFGSYCAKNPKLSIEKIEILVKLILQDGLMSKSEIKGAFGNTLSSIELDHLLNELVNDGLLEIDGFSDVELTDEGKAMVVDSNLAKIVKLIKSKIK